MENKERRIPSAALDAVKQLVKSGTAADLNAELVVVQNMQEKVLKASPEGLTDRIRQNRRLDRMSSV